MTYRPPYSITSKMIELIVEINKQIQRNDLSLAKDINLTLKKSTNYVDLFFSCHRE